MFVFFPSYNPINIIETYSRRDGRGRLRLEKKEKAAWIHSPWPFDGQEQPRAADPLRSSRVEMRETDALCVWLNVVFIVTMGYPVARCAIGLIWLCLWGAMMNPALIWMLAATQKTQKYLADLILYVNV